MTTVFETDEGVDYEKNRVKRKEKCDFCGETGDDILDGKTLRISNEEHYGTHICRDCVVNGVSREKLQDELGTKQEIKEKRQKKEVELA